MYNHQIVTKKKFHGYIEEIQGYRKYENYGYNP